MNGYITEDDSNVEAASEKWFYPQMFGPTTTARPQVVVGKEWRLQLGDKNLSIFLRRQVGMRSSLGNQ